MSEDKIALITRLVNPLPDPKYTVNVFFSYLERALTGYSDDWGLNLDPDFQRGHVWTTAQQEAFVEGMLRGTVGESLRVIQFNAPHWEDDQYAGDLPAEIQIIDGLQRLTAVRKFMAGEVRAFGLLADEFKGTPFSPHKARFSLLFSIHSFGWRKDLLRYYLDINTGGTPHSAQEIERVRHLLSLHQESNS